VAFRRREGRGQQNRSNYDEDDRKRIPNREVSAMKKFAKQKKETNRRNNCRAHQAANGAAAAGAANSIAHSIFSSQTPQKLRAF